MFFNSSHVNSENPDIYNFINKHSKNLMRLCYLYLGDHQIAEDAVQDTLTKAYMKYNTFKNQSSEKTWVTRIAINVCKNYLRKASNCEYAADDQISLHLASEDESNAQYRDEESIQLLNAVYSLPEIYKQVILLYYYQDLKTAEIAKILKEKENTISVRLKRGRDILKQALKEE